MSLRGDDDDTSGGSVTQGGHRDAGAPGPARSSGNSFIWVAVFLLVGVVVLVAWLGGTPHKKAPAEANTVTMSHGLDGGSSGASAASGTPAR